MEQSSAAWRGQQPQGVGVFTRSHGGSHSGRGRAAGPGERAGGSRGLRFPAVFACFIISHSFNDFLSGEGHFLSAPSRESRRGHKADSSFLRRCSRAPFTHSLSLFFSHSCPPTRSYL